MRIHQDYKLVNINSIHLDPENARMHPDRNINEIKASLTKFGFVNPLIVNKNTNTILGGNGTFQAAIDLGFKEVPVLFVDVNAVDAVGLSIALNKIGESSNWNLEQLNKLLSELDEWNPEVNWEAMGFQEDEIRPLLNIEFGKDSGAVKMSGETPENITEENIKEDAGKDRESGGKALKLTKSQRDVIDTAVDTFRSKEGDEKIPEGRIIELICLDYLGSA